MARVVDLFPWMGNRRRQLAAEALAVAWVAFPDYHIELMDLVAEGDRVVFRVTPIHVVGR